MELTRNRNKNVIMNILADYKLNEQFRNIRTNIHFLSNEERDKVFLITSSTRNEGKSTVAANLAASIAFQKEKVLLIDANIRNNSVHSLFLLRSESGLTDFLSTKHMSYRECIKSTAINNLDIMTVGSMPNVRADIIESVKMNQLLEEVKKDYDVIIIDSPSILEVSDTKILASLSDGIIIVVNKGMTNTKELQRSIRELQYVEEKIVGLILNHNKKNRFQKLFKRKKS